MLTAHAPTRLVSSCPKLGTVESCSRSWDVSSCLLALELAEGRALEFGATIFNHVNEVESQGWGVVLPCIIDVEG